MRCSFCTQNEGHQGAASSLFWAELWGPEFTGDPGSTRTVGACTWVDPRPKALDLAAERLTVTPSLV
jgi:hypothetical protein